jgi:hypothetical protein
VFEAGAAREAEILVLRPQLPVLSRKSRKRVRLRSIDRLILVWLYHLFPSVLEAIVIKRTRSPTILSQLSPAPTMQQASLVIGCLRKIPEN